MKIVFITGILLCLATIALPADKVIHVIPHSHWDREWYLPFEKHRIRLVKLIDDVLNEIQKYPDFFFLMDGQTIPFDDYLQVKPENRELLQKAILSGNISYGPQYILQDAFLTDAESHVRNHLIALLEAEKWRIGGGPSPGTDDISKPPFFMNVGYFPDTFGNISQSPQILKGFGIDVAMVGRGFAPEKTGSEFWWQSPDGSRVLTHNFSDWYCNGKELTANADELWPRLHNSLKYATGPNLLLMNGCDHQPLQKDLLAVISQLNNGLDNAHVKLSSPAKFLQAVQQSSGPWKTFIGEARYQQRKSGLGLEDVLSSRLYLKQANVHSLLRLERYAEPLAAFASQLADYEYPHDLINYVWKLLLQNQVHDDICGCSVDQVHQDMMCRYRHADEVIESIIHSAFEALVSKIDLQGNDSQQAALVVYNPTIAERNEVMTATVDFPEGTQIPGIEIRDHKGNIIPGRLLKTERQFKYDLPDDRFRVPYHVERATIQFTASVPGLGYVSYFISPTQNSSKTEKIVHASERSLENEFLKIVVNDNGSITLTDKQSGKVFPDLCQFVLRSDHGDEYNFRAVENETPFLINTPVKNFQIVSDNGLIGMLSFSRKVKWGQELDANQNRVGDGELILQTNLTLRAHSPFLEVSVLMDNHIKDYRLRAYFPTGIKSKWIYSEGDFSIDKRPVKPIKGYERDSYSLPQHSFSAITNERYSFILANRGLTEIEPVVEKDGSVTLGLTLLRCIGELGDWGDFPTFDSQCQGRQVAEFAIMPASGRCFETRSFEPIYNYVLPLQSFSSSPHKGPLSPRGKIVEINVPGFLLSTIKKTEKRPSMIIRGFNPSNQSLSGTIKAQKMSAGFLTNLMENRLIKLNGADSFQVNIDPFKIVTFELGN